MSIQEDVSRRTSLERILGKVFFPPMGNFGGAGEKRGVSSAATMCHLPGLVCGVIHGPRMALAMLVWVPRARGTHKVTGIKHFSRYRLAIHI